jgi:PAS domain S-box-containing protein
MRFTGRFPGKGVSAVAARLKRRNTKKPESLFTSIFSLTPDPIAVSSLKTGRIVNANPAFARWTGYSPEEFTGASTMELGLWVEPRDRGAIIEALETGGEINGVEVAMRQRSGRIRNVLCSAGVIRIGRMRYLLTIIHDITERRGAEEALRESEQEFKDLAEQSITGIYVIQNGAIIYANLGFAAMLGYTVEEVVGRLTIKDIVFPEDWPLVKENIRKRISGEVASVHYEFRVVTGNGSTRDAEVYSSRTLYGGKPAIIGTCIDITERKQTERALKESRQRFRDLVETLYDWVWEVDSQGRYTYASPQIKNVLGYGPEEVIGRTPYDLMAPAEAERVAGNFGHLIRQAKPILALENVNIHKDGHLVVLETNGLPFYDTAGNLEGYRGTDRDVTTRKQAEEALRESRQRFQDLVETVYDCIWETDARGLYTYVSPQIKNVLGYDPEEIVGRTVYDLMYPEEAKHVSETLRTVVDQKKPIVALENGHIHKDGHLVVLETNGLPFYDAAGNLKGYRGTDRDITARKEIEEERERLIRELQEALSKVRTLSGLLPICASCKKIRNDKGYWEQIELYIKDHSDASFTHGICPECGERLYPDFYKKSG